MTWAWEIGGTRTFRDVAVNVLEQPDAPDSLTLSNTTVDESDGAIIIGELAATDADNEPAFDFDILFDASGLLSVAGNRLVAFDGLDLEALAENPLVSIAGNGDASFEVILRVTDSDGLHRDENPHDHGARPRRHGYHDRHRRRRRAHGVGAQRRDHGTGR